MSEDILSETSQESATSVVSDSEHSASSSVHQSSNDNYAGFWIRFTAYLIDSLIIFIISLPVSIPINMLSTATKTPNFVGSILGILITVSYFVLFWTREGQTLGMRLVAIRVQKEDGQKIDVGTGIVRYIGMIISAFLFCLGFIWVGIDKRKQGWHDKIAKTEVVHTGEKGHKKIAGLIIGIWFLTFIILGISVLIFSFFILKLSPDTASVIKEANKSFTQKDADVLASETFDKVNSFRKEHNLPVLVEDQSLCAYTHRRLQQLSSDPSGKGDEGKGLIEDWANREINNAYFINFSEVGERVSSSQPFVTGDGIIADWTPENINNQNYLITYMKYNYACLRADTNFVYIVAGTHK